MGKAIEVLLVVSNTKTSFGEDLVSETMTFFPSGETVSTLPVMPLNSETVGGVPELITISPLVPRNPKSVPIYAFEFVLRRSKTNELGVAGSVTAAPTVLAGAVIGTSVLKQPLVVAQFAETPVLETKMVLAG